MPMRVPPFIRLSVLQTICVISGSYGPSLALIGKSTHVVLYGKQAMLLSIAVVTDSEMTQREGERESCGQGVEHLCRCSLKCGILTLSCLIPCMYVLPAVCLSVCLFLTRPGLPQPVRRCRSGKSTPSRWRPCLCSSSSLALFSTRE